MIIAVNTRCLTKDEPGECGNFINEVFSRIAKLYKEHTLIFIFDRLYNPALVFLENIIPVVTGPPANTPLKYYIWNNVKIPLVLKKYKADVFISTDFCSFMTKVPQCLISHDLTFLKSPSLKSKGHLFFYKKNFNRSLKKANTIISVTEYLKADIIKNYKTRPGKIQVVYSGVNENHQRVTQQERESVKEKYAEGNEYFIHTGKIHPGANLINVLKAFSAFKKRQKSGMQLLIITNGGKYYEPFLSTVSLFRFKEDVNILNGLTQNEISKITASAYAMVHPSFFESFGSSLIDAMKYDVPIITSLTGAMPEICGDAALYADPENFKDIAVKMMTLFKDENLRKELIEKGKLQVQKYNWNTTAELVWNSIEKTIGL